ANMSDIILTRQQYEGWLNDMDRLSHEQEALEARIAQLKRKIDAASTLMESPPPEPEWNPDGKAPRSLVDAIVMLLERRSPTRLTPGEIRSQLSVTGFTTDFNSSYFYTALSRLKEADRINHEPQSGTYGVEVDP